VAFSLVTLAQIHCDQRRYAEAEISLQHALAIQEKAFGKSHPEVAVTLSRYAALLAAAHRKKEAITFSDRAKAILASNAGLRGKDTVSIDDLELKNAWKTDR
jgi:hypothetical protein